MRIRFGTDGWRAIIGRDFTVANVIRVTEGVVRWLKEEGGDRLGVGRAESVLVGCDGRFGGALFVNAVVRTGMHLGCRVVRAREPVVTTPSLSWMVRQGGYGVGVMLTASHNPYWYHGYKLKGSFGGPLSSEVVRAIEAYVPDRPVVAPEEIVPDEVYGESVPVLESYIGALRERFPIERIQRHIRFAYESMYGAGHEVMKRLFPGVVHLHPEVHPLFRGCQPEPIVRNLREACAWMARHPEVAVCLVTDGDADRMGLVLQGGWYLTPQHIILLVFHLLIRYRGVRSGKALLTVSVSERVARYIEQSGWEVVRVPVGFKHIAPAMAEDKTIIVGAEESGGIAFQEHLPERDGIWCGLFLLEHMVETGKSLRTLMEEALEETGTFTYLREDIPLRALSVAQLKERVEVFSELGRVGPWEVRRVDRTDGVRLLLNGERWVLVRPSGTEPLVRVYVEGNTPEEARLLVEAVRSVLGLDGSGG